MWMLIEKFFFRKLYNCGWIVNFGFEFIFWFWFSNLFRWFIYFVVIFKMLIFEIFIEWVKGSVFFKLMNVWFIFWIFWCFCLFVVCCCWLIFVSMCFFCFFSLCLFCWVMGLLIFFKFLFLLIEEGVGEFFFG